MSDRAAVEVFHLAFLRSLVVGPTEKAHVTVKGGCNLRFFFKSPRYSEDMDLDVGVIAPGTLKKNVDKLLSGPQLGRQLSALGLGIRESTAPKQTETTQRWKIQLETENGTNLPTKIEFSRRPAEDDAELASVDRTLLDTYGLASVNARHYTFSAAIRQKVRALAQRKIAQARDVFDLDLLLTRAGRAATDPTHTRDILDILDGAQKRALSISHDEYSAQVIAYLTPEEQELYRSEDTWEQMRIHVADTLERMKP